MDFYIQANNPKYTKEKCDTDATVSEAMETIFPMYTEDAVLMWNHMGVILSYKYDISYMIDDILELIKRLQTEKTGEMYIAWLPDTFRCDWWIKWSRGEMEIETKWENIYGNTEAALNSQPSLCISVDEFVAEWKKVFEIILYSLKSCGYEEDDIEGMTELEKCYESIERAGVLYQ